MENKKTYIIIIIILIAYLLIILLLNQNKIFEKNGNYIIFSDSTILKIDNKNFEYTDKIDNIQKYKFKVYDYNKYLGEYKVNYIDGKYRVFNQNNIPIKFEKDMIAIFSNKNKIELNTSSVEEIDYDDEIIIQNTLAKENIKTPQSYTAANKRKINIKDKSQMYIYNVTYNDSLNENNNQYFSILFISDGEKNYIINKSVVPQENFIDLKSFYINSIIDIDNDGTDEIIVDTLSYSQMEGKKKSIYKLSKDKYQEIKVKI